MPNIRPEFSTPPHSDRKREGDEMPGLSSYSALHEMSVRSRILRGKYIRYVSTVNRMPLCKPTALLCGVTFL